ncbi:Putative S-adenosyl-L-methionine-dependent methyltransferase [Candidatus Izimaplasma bacterium HR1]|jgi:methyltransferase (TIGR00027 family)|uniref:class I SAM-dependent methyltransferase n=1 Tax=Candidatus Izimoplasma sp. HR1 TaxID=1541959 RepID=UPI0004F8FBF5|nr:Putative S-adenosyl-L-methionine-dependent methyltransferase [Candidatus Izimaplasma bacterium HR1]
MNEYNKKQQFIIVRFLIRLFQIIIYIPIQIVFIPFAILGLGLGLYKEMVISKRLEVSFSAVQALQYRWIMHYFETRHDPISVAFTKNFPCESHFGLWAVMGPFIITQKLFSFRTRLGNLVEPGFETLDSTAGRRVLEFDYIFEKYIDEVDQIVLPGSGFDLIAQRYTKDKDVKVFELDQEKTLNVKLDTLKKAQIDYDWITYIPVNYDKESWDEKLISAGFDKTKKTLFIWQSVSLYLDRSIVEETLKKMSALCTKGSIIAQDFYSKAFLDGSISKIAIKNMNMIAKQGEPWKFALDMKDNPRYKVASFLEECNLKMINMNLFGEKLEKEPFYCIVEAKRI